MGPEQAAVLDDTTITEPPSATSDADTIDLTDGAVEQGTAGRVDTETMSVVDSPMRVRKRNGDLEPVDLNKIVRAVARCAAGLEGVDTFRVATRTISGLCDGATTEELDELSIRTAAALIVDEPNYSKLAARLLATYIDKEVELANVHSFSQSIALGHELGTVGDEVAAFVAKNARKLNSAIDTDRNWLFEFFGMRTLYDRYLLRHPQTRKVLEHGQYFLLRVACGLSRNADEAIELYDLLSSLDYLTSSPTLFNSGTVHPQMSSCYLLDSPVDTLEGIYDRYRDIAQLSKFAGGIGVAWHRIRARGSLIRGTNGLSNGIVPWLKTLDSSVAAVNQGGRRKGAACVYLETWHADIEEFLELRENTGDESRRAHNLNLANWVPDLFMERVEKDWQWSLFDPKKVPHLVDLYGHAFEKAYVEAEQSGLYERQLPARQLYSRMMRSLAQTGNGWMTFKDKSNKTCNQTAKPENVVHLSNLCTEILEVTNQEQTAVCIAEGTPVLTSEGLVPIEKCDGRDVFVPFESDEKITVDPRFEQATLLDNGVQEVVRVEFEDGDGVTATPDHRFLVRSNAHRGLPKHDTFVWKQANELQAGDLLVSPNHEPIITTRPSRDESWLAAGWLVGDGWQRDEVYGVCFGPDEILARDIVVAQLAQWHQESELGHNAPHHRAPAVRTDRNGVHNWASERKGFISYIQRRFGIMAHLAAEKTMPENLDTTNHDAVRSFLSGLFSADGHIGVDKGKTYIALTSASESLLIGVRSLLTAYGIHGRIRYSRRPDGRQWGILNLSGEGNVANFERHIGFLLAPAKQEKLDQHSSGASGFSGLREHATVRSVAPAGTKRVYDLVLATGHHFVAQGVVVHNCNLGSINLGRLVKDGPDGRFFDFDRLTTVTRTAVRYLDRVIDINYYPTPEAGYSNNQWRPVGLGVMGLQDVFFKLRMAFDSDEARDLSRRIAECIYFDALWQSTELAAQDGPHERFDDTRAAQGDLQFDLWGVKPSPDIDWAFIRARIAEHGLRNSLVIAIAPTATIASIAGAYECIEPQVSNLFKRETLSGEFLQINHYLVRDLQERGLWNESMANKIKQGEGSVQAIAEVPDDLKALYRTAWEIPMRSLIDMAAERGAFIDQSQSLNLFMEAPTIGKLSSMYLYAWKAGLKTTYYLRSRPATRIRQTVDTGGSNTPAPLPEPPTPKKQFTDDEALACSIENPEACEACD